MSFLDAAVAFTKRLNAIGLTVPIKHENQQFDVPTGTYVAAYHQEDSEGLPITLGANNSTVRNRFVGVYIIQIFTPMDKGTGEGLGIADQIISQFTRVQFSHGTSGVITCLVPGCRPIGKSPDGRFQFNVTIPFYRDQG